MFKVFTTATRKELMYEQYKWRQILFQLLLNQLFTTVAENRNGEELGQCVVLELELGPLAMLHWLCQWDHLRQSVDYICLQLLPCSYNVRIWSEWIFLVVLQSLIITYITKKATEIVSRLLQLQA